MKKYLLPILLILAACHSRKPVIVYRVLDERSSDSLAHLGMDTGWYSFGDHTHDDTIMVWQRPTRGGDTIMVDSGLCDEITFGHIHKHIVLRAKKEVSYVNPSHLVPGTFMQEPYWTTHPLLDTANVIDGIDSAITEVKSNANGLNFSDHGRGVSLLGDYGDVGKSAIAVFSMHDDSLPKTAYLGTAMEFSPPAQICGQPYLVTPDPKPSKVGDRDTFLILMLCSDTAHLFVSHLARNVLYLDSSGRYSHPEYDSTDIGMSTMLFTARGYEVWEKRDRNNEPYVYEGNNLYWAHVEYLDADKKPLRKSIVVWISKRIQ